MTTTVVVTALRRPPRSLKKRRPQKHVPVQKRGEMNVDNSNKRGLLQRPLQQRHFQHRHRQCQPLQLLHFQLGKSLRKRQVQQQLQPRQRDDELPSNEQPLLLPAALAKVQAKRQNQQHLHRNSNNLQKRVEEILLPTFNLTRLQWWINSNNSKKQLIRTIQLSNQPPKKQEMKNYYPSAIKRRSNKRARHVLKNYVKNDNRVD
mmetsp:Transcript_37406/g.76422  ORF Transcript_37406/g.76422 Transcript_37406/m.76422 type:complete len:204 (+) Transcript_37406:98-709(+)